MDNLTYLIVFRRRVRAEPETGGYPSVFKLGPQLHDTARYVCQKLTTHGVFNRDEARVATRRGGRV